MLYMVQLLLELVSRSRVFERQGESDERQSQSRKTPQLPSIRQTGWLARPGRGRASPLLTGNPARTDIPTRSSLESMKNACSCTRLMCDGQLVPE